MRGKGYRKHRGGSNECHLGRLREEFAGGTRSGLKQGQEPSRQKERPDQNDQGVQDQSVFRKR